MSCRFHEPSLQDMLSDPVIQAVMAADRVDPHELEAIMLTVRQPATARWWRRATNAFPPD